MLDLHSHVLPGLDDGAVDLSESLAICRAAAADGIRVLAATPHVRGDFPTTPAQMESGLRELQTVVGDVIRLVPGGEIDLEELSRPLEELRRFGLGGNPRYLLVEMPYAGWPLDLAEKFFQLRIAGITPVLAHPERNPDVQANPELLEPIVAGGAIVQLTASSIDGRGGRSAGRCARTLLDRQLTHLLASDAHSPDLRAIGLSAAVSAIGDEELARWLTEGVPRAIVDGTSLPSRPERRRSRPLFRRR